MPTLNILKSKFQEMVRKGDAALAQFKIDLEKNPNHAFEWADNVMLKTVERSVGEHYLKSIETWTTAHKAGTLNEHQPKDEGGAVEFIHASILRTALQYARVANQSTSPTANRMRQFEAAVYADLASDWEFIY